MKFTHTSVHFKLFDMCVVHVGVQVLERVVELNAVRPCGAERICGSACLGVGGVECEVDAVNASASVVWLPA